MKPSSNVFLHNTIVGSSDHYLVWTELEKTSSRNGKQAKCILYKWQLYRLRDKVIRNEYQTELGLYAKDFFKL